MKNILKNLNFQQNAMFIVQRKVSRSTSFMQMEAIKSKLKVHADSFNRTNNCKSKPYRNVSELIEISSEMGNPWCGEPYINE